MLKISFPPPYPFIISASENSTYWNHPKKQNSFVDSMVDKHRRIPPTKPCTLNISALVRWKWMSRKLKVLLDLRVEGIPELLRRNSWKPWHRLSLWHKQQGPFEWELNFVWFSPEVYNDLRCISKKIFSMVWLRQVKIVHVLPQGSVQIHVHYFKRGWGVGAGKQT